MYHSIQTVIVIHKLSSEGNQIRELNRLHGYSFIEVISEDFPVLILFENESLGLSVQYFISQHLLLGFIVTFFYFVVMKPTQIAYPSTPIERTTWQDVVFRDVIFCPAFFTMFHSTKVLLKCSKLRSNMPNSID